MAVVGPRGRKAAAVAENATTPEREEEEEEGGVAIGTAIETGGVAAAISSSTGEKDPRTRGVEAGVRGITAIAGTTRRIDIPAIAIGAAGVCVHFFATFFFHAPPPPLVHYFGVNWRAASAGRRTLTEARSHLECRRKQEFMTWLARSCRCGLMKRSSRHLAEARTRLLLTLLENPFFFFALLSTLFCHGWIHAHGIVVIHVASYVASPSLGVRLVTWQQRWLQPTPRASSLDIIR